MRGKVGFRVATASVVFAMFAMLTWRIIEKMRDRAAPLHVRAIAPVGPDWRGRVDLAVDPDCGHVARALVRREFEVEDLGGGNRRSVVFETDEHGFFAPAPRGDPIPGPRVLLLGDDVLHGVSATASLGRRLQERVRAFGRDPETSVLEASVDGYGPVEIAMRTRALVPRFEPMLVVFVIAVGDDLLALDDPTRPHFDDALAFARAAATGAPEVDLGALAERAPGLVARDLAQADYLHRNPGRLRTLEEKLAAALAIASQVAPRRAASLLVVLVPPVSAVDPATVAGLGPEAERLVATEVQHRRHAAVRALVAGLDYGFVDLLPRFVDATQPVFLADGRLSAHGIELTAAALAPRVHRILSVL